MEGKHIVDEEDSILDPALRKPKRARRKKKSTKEDSTDE